MQDKFCRNIDYLRISVTDRCNYRCIYCMPAEGIEQKSHEEMLTLEEIIRTAANFAQLGIKRIRLTGGEPLVRKDIVSLVRRLEEIPNIDDISLTTNGLLLPKYAYDLQAAGLRRVNISLDSLQPERFHAITRIGNLADVLRAIDIGLEVGFSPLKINVVLSRGVNDDELFDFVELARARAVHVRFIELMPIGESDGKALDQFIPVSEIKLRLAEKYDFSAVADMFGGGPANYLQIPGFKGTIGLISALSNHFCSECNRMRLTADGKLRPCLYGETEYDLREKLRANISDEELQVYLRTVLLAKPERHQMEAGWGNQPRSMSQIGG
ncbi:MAG: GTP 3',8-cyclase MoaA [Clostridia bacterium]